MKKTILSLIAISAICTTAQAQVPSVGESRTVQISPTTAILVIDGELDAAYASAYVSHSDGRWIGTPPVEPDTDFSWYSLYDDENLYLYLDVRDEVIITGDSANLWHDDAVEIFFDGNNNKGGTFDGNNDVKIVVGPSLQTGEPIVLTGGFPPPPAGADFSGLQVAQKISDTGWAVEIKMPLSIIKLQPVAGNAFGIDFIVRDDDTGSGSTSMALSWSSGAHLNNRTDLFGTAILADQPQLPTLALLVGASLLNPVMSLYDSELGMFVENSDFYGAWVYHVGLGWLYTGVLSLESEWLWFYSPALDMWLATSVEHFPVFSGDDSWLYLDNGYYYDYQLEMWIEVP